MTDLTVVILTKNEERNLRKCVESFRGVAKRFVIVDGIKYKGILEAATDTVFKSNSFAFSNPNKMLSSILRDEHGGITIDSKFKPIDIRKISNDYRFLGGKAECEKYIKEMLIRKPKEKYVNRTVLRKHNLNDENMKDAKYVSSYEKVEY